jgi:Lipocalin-like domain
MNDMSVAGGSLSRELVGTWELVSRIDRTATGERRVEPLLGEDPVALLYYDRSGHFAAQFMRRNRAVSSVPDADTADSGSVATNNSRARGGYDAYFGTYTVDEARGTVTQRLLGALSPENVGQVLTRAMTVDGTALTITLETAAAGGEPVIRCLTFTRVG